LSQLRRVRSIVMVANLPTLTHVTALFKRRRYFDQLSDDPRGAAG
jgi:hypothetical protein